MNEFLGHPLRHWKVFKFRFCALCTSDHGSNAGLLSESLRLWTAQFRDFIERINRHALDLLTD